MNNLLGGFRRLHRRMVQADGDAGPTSDDPQVGKESATERRPSAVWLPGVIAAAVFILTAPTAPLLAQQITQIIAAGTGNSLAGPAGVAVDSVDNVYVAGGGSNNVFKITPGGTITQIIDSTGDGMHGLDGPGGVAVDSVDNIYVAGGGSDNVFQITPGGTITQIIDRSGDGMHGLDGPNGVAVDSVDNVYVAGGGSNNVFQITPGGTITEIIDGTNGLERPGGVAVDSTDNVYVAGRRFDDSAPENRAGTVFKIAPDGTITQFDIRAAENLGSVALDSADNVYVAGRRSSHVLPISVWSYLFKITPAGAISTIIQKYDAADEEAGGRVGGPVAVDSADNVYVVEDGAVDQITPDGTITQIIDSTGDGTNGLDRPSGVAVDSAGNVYVAGGDSNNVFKIAPVAVCVGDCDGDGMVVVNELVLGVDIALGEEPVDACPAFRHADTVADIAQLIKGVHSALDGCPAG